MILTESRNPKSTHIDALSTHDMLCLINQEDQTVPLAVQQQIPWITLAVDAIAAAFEQGGRLIYVGAGTSGRLGMLDAVECPPTYGVNPELVITLLAGGREAMFRAMEQCEDDFEQGKRDLLAQNVCGCDVVVGLSASGSARYVLGALAQAEEAGAVTVGFSCNPGSSLERSCQIPITVLTGPEVITGSTRMKAGTAEKLVLNMLTTGAMIRTGKVYENLMINLRPKNEKLKRRAASIVSQILDCGEEEARTVLSQHQWNVRKVLESARQQSK